MDVSSHCHYEVSMGRMRLWANSFGLWLAAPGESKHLIQPANFYRGMVSKIQRLGITPPALGVLCGQAKWGPLKVGMGVTAVLRIAVRHT